MKRLLKVKQKFNKKLISLLKGLKAARLSFARAMRSGVSPLVLIVALGLIGSNLPTKRQFIEWKVSPSVIKITSLTNHQTGGTGFVIDTPRGRRVLTNHHVCDGMPGNGTAGFLLNASNPILLRIERMSKKTDLCLLEMANNNALPALSMGSPVQPGDAVNVIGFPLFDPMTYASGIVIAPTIVPLARMTTTEHCEADEVHGEEDGLFEPINYCLKFFSAYLMDTMIYSGNSGSPVVDGLGRVVGIVFAGNSVSHKGLFIGVEEIEKFLNESN